MGQWIKQPNGLLAVFSSVSDDLIWINVESIAEIADVLINHTEIAERAPKIAAAVLAQSGAEWEEAIQTIRDVRGQKAADDVIAMCSQKENAFSAQRTLETEEPYARIAQLETALQSISQMADLGNTTGVNLEHAQSKLREIQRVAAETLEAKGS